MALKTEVLSDDKDEEKGSSQVPGNTEKTVDAYGNLSRGLTSEELSQSGTQKLILNDLLKAESKVKELEPFKDLYYKVLTEKSVLKEKLNKSTMADILYSFCITSGGLIFGLAKLFLDDSSKISSVMFIIAALLIIGGILFKFRYTKNEN